MPFDPNDSIDVGCGQTITRGPVPVWTNGTTTAMFHPVTRWMSAAEVTKVRRSLEMQAESGLIDIAVAFQTANNLDTPIAYDPAKDDIDSYRTANGYSWGTSFIDISGTTAQKQYIRFGIAAKNSSGSHVECAQAWFRIDLDPR